MLGTVTDLIAFAGARGVTISQTEAPIFLTKAADFLNAQKWIGIESDPAQVDSWPRLLPGDSIDTATPAKVLTAAYRLAMLAADGVDLQPVISGPHVLEERVEGVIQMKYSEALVTQPDIPWLDSLIGPWIDTTTFTGAANVSVGRG